MVGLSLSVLWLKPRGTCLCCVVGKWFQTTLQISFTKVKAVLDPLEKRGFIFKTQAEGDHRVKDINLTEKGFKFISEIMDILPGS